MNEPGIMLPSSAWPDVDGSDEPAAFAGDLAIDLAGVVAAGGRTVAVDPSRTMIEMARARTQERGVEVDFVRADALGVYAVSRSAADRVWDLRSHLDAAVDVGTVEPAIADAYWNDLGARDDAGEFFAGVVGFRVIACKPAAGAAPI